jgi:hypothetical protein
MAREIFWGQGGVQFLLLGGGGIITPDYGPEADFMEGSRDWRMWWLEVIAAHLADPRLLGLQTGCTSSKELLGAAARCKGVEWFLGRLALWL